MAKHLAGCLFKSNGEPYLVPHATIEVDEPQLRVLKYIHRGKACGLSWQEESEIK